MWLIFPVLFRPSGLSFFLKLELYPQYGDNGGEVFVLHGTDKIFHNLHLVPYPAA